MFFFEGKDFFDSNCVTGNMCWASVFIISSAVLLASGRERSRAKRPGPKPGAGGVGVRTRDLGSVPHPSALEVGGKSGSVPTDSRKTFSKEAKSTEFRIQCLLH